MCSREAVTIGLVVITMIVGSAGVVAAGVARSSRVSRSSGGGHGVGGWRWQGRWVVRQTVCAYNVHQEVMLYGSTQLKWQRLVKVFYYADHSVGYVSFFRENSSGQQNDNMMRQDCEN